MRQSGHSERTKLGALIVLLVVIFVLATGGLAWADNVTNDVTAGGTDTIAAGASTTVKYKIVGTGGDGQSGCNASDGTPATATIVHPAEVAVTPATLAFSACNAQQSTTFTSTTPGDYAITVNVSDSGPGSYSTSPAAFTLHVLDITPPDTEITSAPSDPSSSDAASFSFTGTDDITPAADLTFECDLDGTGFTPCSSPTSYTGLTSGSHTFQVRATDEAGNVDASAAGFTWTVDVVAPDTELSSAPSDPSSSDAASFSFTGTDDITPAADLTFECDLDGAGFSACSSPTSYTGLTSGSHIFQVRAGDSLGNIDSSPASFTWTVDLSDPVLTLGDNSSTPGGTLLVSGSGFAPGAEITVTMESTPVLLAITNADEAGSFSIMVTIPPGTSPGVHTIKAAGLGPDGLMRVLSSPLTITAGVASSEDVEDVLASTGLPLLGWMIAGLMFMATGVSLRRSRGGQRRHASR